MSEEELTVYCPKEGKDVPVWYCAGIPTSRAGKRVHTSSRSGSTIQRRRLKEDARWRKT